MTNDTSFDVSRTPRPLYSAAIAGLLILGACEIGSKSVGSETEGTAGDDDGVDDGDGGDDDGQTSAPTSASVGDDGGSADDDGGSEGSSGGECGTPPPIDLAECVACDPQSGSFTNDACVTDCTGQPCGEPCLACPDEQPGCLTSEFVGACDSVGHCAVPSGPDQCMNALQPGFEGDLTEQGGCSDLEVYARSSRDTLGMVLRVDDGLVADAVAAGSPMSTEIDITDASVSFRVETGISITENECSDVIIMEPIVDETWNATAGSIAIELDPDGNGNAFADITLTNVTIERTSPAGGAEAIDIPTYAFTDVLVGWLPG